MWTLPSFHCPYDSGPIQWARGGSACRATPHGSSKTTLSQSVLTSTAVEICGAAHAQTSNKWKIDKHALGCTGGEGVRQNTRARVTWGTGGGNTCPCQ